MLMASRDGREGSQETGRCKTRLINIFISRVSLLFSLNFNLSFTVGFRALSLLLGLLLGYNP